MNDVDLLEPFERLLDAVAPLAALRRIEAGDATDTLWTAIADSGFLDALVPEADGGAGLAVRQVGPLFEALGARLVPMPVAQTMVARSLLAAAGIASPQGPMLLLTPSCRDGKWYQNAVPDALTAEHALVDLGDRLGLTALNGRGALPIGLFNSLSTRFAWDDAPAELASLARPSGGLRPICAVLRAAEIGGAANRLVAMTTAYASERMQFGKPIAKFQAIQQQLAVMAEQAVMARMAARIGYAGGLPPALAAAATAKQVASAAVPFVTATAHAVHGAIGFSAEYDLQLYTRRLYEWRMADGSERYWAEKLGAHRLQSDATTSVEFVRTSFAA